MTAPDHTLSESRAACKEICRSRGRNFYYGLRLTPEPRRSALFAVYAWMRAIDDAADEPGRSAAERHAMLDEVELRTRSTFRGAAPKGGLWPALDHAVRAHKLDIEPFETALAGVRSDIDPPPGYRHETEADLDLYCERVASTVGRLCVRIWGLEPGADAARADELARFRGIAFQRTNILRDLREDYQDGRVYLPVSAFAGASITPDQLMRWDPPGRCAVFIAEQAARARAAYLASAELESMVAPDCRCVLRAMTRIYSDLLRMVERRPSRVADGARLRLSGVRKTAIAVRAIVGA